MANTLETMTQADLIALVLKQQAALTAKNTAKLTFKVSEKGAVSVYGLGRFPITLYASQWARVISVSKDLANFIEVNKGNLATKD
jgi:hypothetical protein